MRLHQGRASSSDSYFELTGIEVSYDRPQMLSNVVLGTGSDGRERRLAWYTEQSHSEGAVVQFAKTADLQDGEFPDDAARVTPESWAAVPFGKDVHHATLSGLEPGTGYTYRLGNAEGSGAGDGPCRSGGGLRSDGGGFRLGPVRDRRGAGGG